MNKKEIKRRKDIDRVFEKAKDFHAAIEEHTDSWMYEVDPLKQMKADYERRTENLVKELQYSRRALSEARDRYRFTRNVQWFESFAVVFFAVMLALLAFYFIGKV